MTAKARLRAVPTIAHEPEEGSRLRDAKAGPSRPWSFDVYELQMRAKVAVTLVEEVFRNLKSFERLYDTDLNVGIEELSFMVHQIATAAGDLQPN